MSISLISNASNPREILKLKSSSLPHGYFLPDCFSSYENDFLEIINTSHCGVGLQALDSSNS